MPDIVGHHGGNHLPVPELISLAVVLQHHADISTGWEADLRPGESCGWVELLHGMWDS